MDSQSVFVLTAAFLALVVVFAAVKPVPQGSSGLWSALAASPAC